MQIIQLLPTLVYGDAVGNDAIALYEYLSRKGYETKIYAENIDQRINKNIVKHYIALPALSSDDILFYHFSTGSKRIAKIIRDLRCRKIMIYHNITPGKYFKEYNPDLTKLVDAGRKDLSELKDVFECCLADSEYNKNDLIKVGYTCPIGILPILIPFKDYEKRPDEKVLNKYKNDGTKNILFTGRIAPNKKQEDVIASFAYYQKYFNPKSRLFIVGNDSGMEIYAKRLKLYVEKLGIEGQVIFTGHVSFEEILAYYKLADVFLCMSDHEGFCVPLVEAMIFSLPILAYRAAAVPETLGNAGIIIEKRNPVLVARVLQRIVDDKIIRKRLNNLMLNRMAYFSYENTTTKFEKYLSAIINKNSIEQAVIKQYREIAEIDLLQSEFSNWENKIMAQDQKPYQFLKFEEVPIILDSRTPSSVSRSVNSAVKKQIKNVLKAFYYRIYRVNPTFADTVRKQIYSLKHRIEGEKVKIQEQLKPLVRENPGLLIDVTQTSRLDLGTGIQRVVNNIFFEIYRHRNERNVLAVRNNLGKIITGNGYVNHFSGGKKGTEYTVTLQQGDKLLLLDSSWDFAEDFSHILDSTKKNNTPSYAVIYDLIPVQYPELVTSSVFANIFRSWHDMVLQKSDSILCISRTTADAVAQYYKKMKFHRSSPLNLYYFHMGADVPGGVQGARKEIQDFVQVGTTFLMVGTLEPRKGHMIALQAFNKILRGNNKDCRLLIIGHDGWKNGEIRKQIKLPEYKGRVLWVEDASDEELRWAYAHTDALIAASRDEGFGLPLVEAAHFGLPIICSDIPIFREVTQGYADFFKVMDADDLTRCIIEWQEAKVHPDSSKIRIYTWQEAAQEILDIIDGKVKPYMVLQ